MAQIAEVNDFLRENCEGDNSAYMICHGLTYSADVFRAAALPDESIRSILAYGAVNPGNDAFPKELFTAQIVLTCTPFDPSNHTEKINSAFWRTSRPCTALRWRRNLTWATATPSRPTAA